MKRFYIINEEDKEQLDMVSLLEGCSDSKLTYDECVVMLRELERYVDIKAK